MNTCVLSGRLTKNAVVRGSEPRVLSFVLEIKQHSNDADRKERVALVPCVLFNAIPDLENLLTTQGKGVHVELEGRIGSSQYESKGDTRLTCEVIARNWTVTILPSITPAG